MTETPTPPAPETAHAEGDADIVPIYVALSRVMRDIGAISKSRQVQSGPARFAFRGIEDVQNALHPVLARHGVMVLPQVLERLDLPVRTTNSGGSQYTVALHVRYAFVGPAGDVIHASAWGEGQDSGDKATGKAHSMSLKSAMLQVFMVPTEDTDDADRNSPEPTFGRVQIARAEAARDAAAKVTALDRLQAIGNTAHTEGILDAPITAEGEAMSLRAYLDRRRAVLTSAPAQHPPDQHADADGPAVADPEVPHDLDGKGDQP